MYLSGALRSGAAVCSLQEGRRARGLPLHGPPGLQATALVMCSGQAGPGNYMEEFMCRYLSKTYCQEFSTKK